MLRVRVAGVLIRKNRLLLVEHTKNHKKYFLLPGGGVEGAETLENSLQREFQEELAMNVSVGKVLQVIQTVSPDGDRSILHMVFQVESSDEPRLNDPDDRLTGFHWLDLSSQNTIEQLRFYPPVLKQLLELIQDSSYNGLQLYLPIWQV